MKKTSSVSVSGSEKVQSAIKMVAKVYPQRLGVALYKLGVTVISEAIPRTPVEFGVLRASHYVSPPSEGRSPVVELGFGTVYARRQHEELAWKHPRGGEARYLANALVAVGPRALKLLARWTMEGGRWGQVAGMPTSPIVSSGARAVGRFVRAAKNVRRRIGRK